MWKKPFRESMLIFDDWTVFQSSYSPETSTSLSYVLDIKEVSRVNNWIEHTSPETKNYDEKLEV